MNEKNLQAFVEVEALETKIGKHVATAFLAALEGKSWAPHMYLADQDLKAIARILADIELERAAPTERTP